MRRKVGRPRSVAANRTARVIIHFTEEEVEILDRAVDRINSKPGNRATRSDVLRVGALKHATEILDPEAAQKAAGGSAA